MKTIWRQVLSKTNPKTVIPAALFSKYVTAIRKPREKKIKISKKKDLRSL